MTNLENMITVKNLRKEFKKTIKEPGIKGSIKSFFNPKSEIVEAVKDISFTAEKGEKTQGCFKACVPASHKQRNSAERVCEGCTGA